MLRHSLPMVDNLSGTTDTTAARNKARGNPVYKVSELIRDELGDENSNAERTACIGRLTLRPRIDTNFVRHIFCAYEKCHRDTGG
jgi:hypothetical protein